MSEDENPDQNKMKYKRIPVSTGVNDLGFVEVNLPTGTSENVKIVTNGAYTLSSEMVKGELEHGH